MKKLFRSTHIRSGYTGLLAVCCLAFSNCTTVKKVTFSSMLQEMTDRESLARFPSPAFSLAQFSSYDRATVKPGDSTWFANWDRSMFIREETNAGRKEYVMFDAQGPGAVVRFWMTFAGEDSGKGTLRIYIDGQEEPVISGTAVDILSGTGLVNGPLASSVSDITDYHMRGHNLYLPVPYAKSCKITYESSNIKDAGAKTGGESVYYNINYRTYRDARVRSFSRDDLEKDRPVLDAVQQKLKTLDRQTDGLNLSTTSLSRRIGPGQSAEFPLPAGSAAIRHLVLKLDARNIEQALRSTVLEMTFDGERTVWSPVGDFFGTGYQLRHSNTWYTRVDSTGTMNAWWVMPYREGARIVVHNLGTDPVTTEGEARSAPWKWDARSMHFGASWHQFTNLFTGEMKNNEGAGSPFDINYVELTGKGVYVGDAISLFNTVYAWWGEGDEKVYVDGEQFPSHIGTGTEDYYGYAWCRPERFSGHPYIAQPDGSGNFVPGYTVNMRLRGLDAIPFTTSLKFDMEMWHWTRARINFAPVSFRYMLPGGRSNVLPDPGTAKKPVVLKREELIPPVIAGGKIEAESMILDNHSGGNFRYQNNVRYGWSDNMQVFWTDARPGDKLTLRFRSETEGEFDAVAGVTMAPDYGRFRMTLNGQPLGDAPVDLYAPKLRVDTTAPGRVSLKKGENLLEITVTEARPNEKRTAFFGLDYLKFTAAAGR